MIRILVVDDQALVRAGFRMILSSEADLEVVGEASTGAEAVAAATALRPDVVLMDVRMPVMDGIDATRTIVRDAGGDGPQVIILTTFDLDEYVYSALRAGASGFLLKDAPPETLVDAVRVVAAGEALLAPSVTRRLIEEFARDEPPRAGGPAARAPVPGLDLLTEREREVLEQMARGLSNSEIATTLYVSETTVKTHVGHVLTKLGVRDRLQAVIAAFEAGIVVPGGG